MNHFENEIQMIVQNLISLNKNVFIIVSSDDFEGRSTTSLALSSVLKKLSTKEVNLLDTNLRHSIDSTYDKNYFSQINVHQIPKSIQDNEILEILNWINEFIAKHKDSYIIIDTSPINIFNKKNIHPTHFKEVEAEFIMVINSKISKRSQILKAKQMLNSQGISLQGAIINEHYPSNMTANHDIIPNYIWNFITKNLTRSLRWMKILKS